MRDRKAVGDVREDDEHSFKEFLEEDLNIELQSAVRACDLDMVRELLRTGADPEVS